VLCSRRNDVPSVSLSVHCPVLSVRDSPSSEQLSSEKMLITADDAGGTKQLQKNEEDG